MKATDLMIGDWVQNPLGWKAQVQSIRYVNTIKDEWEWIVKIGINNETFQGNLSLNEIGAIPLTPEILEKNGFENDFYEEESVADYHTIRLEGYSLKHNIGEIDGYLITWCNGGVNVTTDWGGCVQKEISFVHDLQHALRLCGIEKEIEL